MDMIQMRLIGVRVEMPTEAPIVLVQEIEGSPRRFVPIFIGDNEARSIDMALSGINPPRPMTHDLLAGILSGLDIEVKAVKITELSERTFFAQIDIAKGSDIISISCRPSDALAIAARIEVPIYCAKSVLEEASFLPDKDSALMADLESGGHLTPDNPEEMVQDFRSFLDTVRPEDFDAQ